LFASACATATDDKIGEAGFGALYSLIDNIFEDKEDGVVVVPDVSKTTTTTTTTTTSSRQEELLALLSAMNTATDKLPCGLNCTVQE
jgi:hypothetical protein